MQFLYVVVLVFFICVKEPPPLHELKGPHPLLLLLLPPVGSRGAGSDVGVENSCLIYVTFGAQWSGALAQAAWGKPSVCSDPVTGDTV